ncbi:hypothetical protein JMN32_13435 [Fulvivirga sp. 29W222]|uniref:Viral A-type inclusion protein n=1 Tax=Fulvivirga marina TaxID=2494733 RepID=A0A937KBS3_9BACT|nr:hypothetical protein [Fulvivirga marina]MBL6447316.1 hypothetical protein [Fulvivirga marina]
MKKLIYTICLCTTLGVFASSCGEGKKQSSEDITIEDKELPAEERAEKALYDEVMAVHDEVMPQMDNMMKLKGELQVKLDLVREKKDSNKEVLQALENGIKKLEEADEAMMQWMRDFEPQDNVEDHEQVINYYTLQKAEIEKVRKLMLSAMKNAKDQLKDIQTQE